MQDWLMGKSINPRIGFLDIKFVTSRTFMIATTLYQFGIVAKNYEVHQTINYTLLLAVTMVLMYLADGFWFETTIINIKEVVWDGCGAVLLVAAGVYIPIQNSIAVNVISSSNYQLPWYCLVVIAGIYCK